MSLNSRNWPQARLPLAPLAALLEETRIERLASLMRVNRNTVAEWFAQGVPLYSADKIAVTCGFHPATVWGDAFYVEARYER